MRCLCPEVSKEDYFIKNKSLIHTKKGDKISFTGFYHLSYCDEVGSRIFCTADVFY